LGWLSPLVLSRTEQQACPSKPAFGWVGFLWKKNFVKLRRR